MTFTATLSVTTPACLHIMFIKQSNMERVMYIFPILLFVISSSLDNFVVGLSYGIKKIKINYFNNLLIALISGIGTFLAMALGNILKLYIPPSLANYIGCGILMLLGIYLIFDFFRLKYKNYNFERKKSNSTLEKIDFYDEILNHPEIIDKDKSNIIEFKESLILGIALSLNNFGLGIGASIIGLNIYLTSLLSIIFSLIFIQAGFYIGHKYFSKIFENYATLISGIIILLLGLYSLVH